MHTFGKISWLKERLVIQQSTQQEDGMGGTEESWAAKTLAWGQLSQLLGGKGSAERLRVLIRAQVPINMPARIAWRGRLYKVVTAPFRCHGGILKSFVIEAISPSQAQPSVEEVQNG